MNLRYVYHDFSQDKNLKYILLSDAIGKPSIPSNVNPWYCQQLLWLMFQMHFSRKNVLGLRKKF